MFEPRPDIAARLAELKRSGAYPMLAIKTIYAEFGLSLHEAKMRFAASPEWAAEQAATNALHQELIDALRTADPDE